MCRSLPPTAAALEQLARAGYLVLPAVFPAEEVARANEQLTAALTAAEGDLAIRTRNATVYAGRNVTEWFPPAADLWRKEPLVDLLSAVLGEDFGLVRALFFDKPPEQPWSLPWHKDMTIAVQRNDLASARFQKPTTKAGIPHIEPPTEVLQRMLTLRLHLDDVDDENGPLLVIPGSHHTGKQPGSGDNFESILVDRGDVLAIRPLVAHSSPAPARCGVGECCTSSSRPTASWKTVCLEDVCGVGGGFRVRERNGTIPWRHRTR